MTQAERRNVPHGDQAGAIALHPGQLGLDKPGKLFWLSVVSAVPSLLVRSFWHLLRYGFRGTWMRYRPFIWNRPIDECYPDWVRRYDAIGDRARTVIRRRIAAMSPAPLKISMVLAAHVENLDHVNRIIGCFQAQLYPHAELCIAADSTISEQAWRQIEGICRSERRIKLVRFKAPRNSAALMNAALDMVSGEFVIFGTGGYQFREHCFYVLATELTTNPDMDLAYCDEDIIDDAGNRQSPHFKSQWDEDLFLSSDMITGVSAYRTKIVLEIDGLVEGHAEDAVYDLSLRFIERLSASRIHHVPFILFHRESGETGIACGRSANGRWKLVKDHLRRRGQGAVITAESALGHLRIRHALAQPEPLVSILIPTRDRADLLRRCVNKVLNATNYKNIEVIIIDNRSVKMATRLYLEHVVRDDRVRVLRYDRPFNFSAMNNCAVREAAGEVLLFLNNDAEPIGRDWLTELVANAMRPEVGAVGARLLFPDGRVQHGGAIFAHGWNEHSGRGLAKNAPGYRNGALLQRSFSAVTGACIAIRRDVFAQVGGFDEGLRVALNDMDICLRIRARGYLVVWTPHAELYHLESATRGGDTGLSRNLEALRECRRFQRRWRDLLRQDPYCSPNLSPVSGSVGAAFQGTRPLAADYVLAFPPNVRRPW